MYRFKMDYRDLRSAVSRLEKVQEVEIIKEVNWYLNQVYAHLYKKHSRRYTYTTPPGTERTNLRMRQGRLLQQLKASRFVTSDRNSVTGGWNIGEGNPKGNYLGIHVAENAGDPKYHLTPSKAKHTYTTKKGEKRILIPLRGGQNVDGTLKPITGRIQGKLRVMPYAATLRTPGFDWSGEKKSKFRAKTIILYKVQGRRKIPMYIIVKQARIPRRLLLGPAMDKYREAFYNRLEKRVQRAVDSV